MGLINNRNQDLKDKLIQIDGIDIKVTKKKIKNMYIRITAREGLIRVSAPSYMNEQDITLFIVSKMDWIKQKKEELRGAPKKERLKYENNSFIDVLGKRYLFKIRYIDKGSHIYLSQDTVELCVREDVSFDKKEGIINEWYREILKNEIPILMEKWEKRIRVKANKWGVKKMKTRWGSCNVIKKNIWINLELAKKPFDYLEYVVVHELIHLLEKSHNEVFKAYMDEFMPDWRRLKKELNQSYSNED